MIFSRQIITKTILINQRMSKSESLDELIKRIKDDKKKQKNVKMELEQRIEINVLPPLELIKKHFITKDRVWLLGGS